MSNLILSVATVLTILYLSPLTTTAANTTVLDTDGHPLQANTTDYYILPVTRGRGHGGLGLTTDLFYEPCPLYIALDERENSDGFPYRFYSVNPKDSLIPLSTDLNINLDVLTFCVQQNIWQLINDTDETGKLFVNINGILGNPGAETLNNWFKIEKAGKGEYDYKFVYCPSVCKSCKPVCGDLGIFVREDGSIMLFFTDHDPLLLNFKKAIVKN